MNSYHNNHLLTHEQIRAIKGVKSPSKPEPSVAAKAMRKHRAKWTEQKRKEVIKYQAAYRKAHKK